MTNGQMQILSTNGQFGSISGVTVNTNNIVFNSGTYYIEYSVIFNCNNQLQGGSNTNSSAQTCMIDFNDQNSIIPGNGGAELATFETVTNWAQSGLTVTGITIAMTYTFGSTSTRYPRVYNLTTNTIDFQQQNFQGTSCLMITKLA